MQGLSLVGKKAAIKTTSDNRQRRPFIEPMISPSNKKRAGFARKVAQNNKSDAVIQHLLFENREKSRNHTFKMNDEVEENLPVNSPNATAWLRSQGLLFQTDIRGLPTRTAAPIFGDSESTSYASLKKVSNPTLVSQADDKRDADYLEDAEDPEDPPPYVTPPSYWRQRFGSSRDENKYLNRIAENTAAPGERPSPVFNLEVEPKPTPSPSYEYSAKEILDSDKMLSITRKSTDEAEVELEVEKWLENVRATTLADGQGQNFNSATINDFDDDNNTSRASKHEITSLMDIVDSPGGFRGRFDDYDTSDTENEDYVSEREQESHAGEARKILRTWLDAENEAERLKSKAKASTLLVDAGMEDQKQLQARANNNHKCFHETLRESKTKEIVLDKNIIKRMRATSSDPRLVIEERQRLLREKRERRRERRRNIVEEKKKNRASMGKLEYSRHQAKKESEVRRRWRLRQKDQRRKQMQRLHSVSDSPPDYETQVNKGTNRSCNPLSKSIDHLSTLVEKQENEVRQMRIEYQRKLKKEKEEKEKARVKNLLKMRLERAKREKILIAKEDLRRRRDTSLLQTCFNSWNQFVLAAFDDRCAKEENDATMKIIFLKWSVYVKTALADQRDTARRKARVQQYRMWVKQSRTFDKWVQFYRNRKHQRKKQRKIDIFARGRRLKRFWSRWRLRVKHVVRRKENNLKATLLYTWRTKNVSLKAWCAFVSQRQKERMKKMRRKKLDKLVAFTSKMHDDQSTNGDEEYDARPEIISVQQASPYESKYSDNDSLPIKSKEPSELPSLHASHLRHKSYEGKYCEFLTSMEERAEQRRIKREARRQRRQAAEEERMYIENVRCIGKSVFLDAAKGGKQFLRRCESRHRKRLAKLREKKLELARQKVSDAIIKNSELCMKYYGFRPWCLFMILARMEKVKAVNYYNRKITFNCVRLWKQCCAISKRKKAVELLRKEARAKTHFRNALKIKILTALKDHHNSLRIREESVRKQREYRLQKETLKYLVTKAREMRRLRHIWNRRADVHYKRRLLCASFRSWRSVMSLLKQETKALARRRALKSKVNTWLKDYDSL